MVSDGFFHVWPQFFSRMSVGSILRAEVRWLFWLLHVAPRGWVYDILDSSDCPFFGFVLCAGELIHNGLLPYHSQLSSGLIRVKTIFVKVSGLKLSSFFLTKHQGLLKVSWPIKKAMETLVLGGWKLFLMWKRMLFVCLLRNSIIVKSGAADFKLRPVAFRPLHMPIQTDL